MVNVAHTPLASVWMKQNIRFLITLTPFANLFQADDLAVKRVASLLCKNMDLQHLLNSQICTLLFVLSAVGALLRSNYLVLRCFLVDHLCSLAFCRNKIFEVVIFQEKIH